jgi:hypothetical protein
MNRNKKIVLAWVDGTRPNAPPAPRVAQAAQAHARIAALVKEAYTQPLPEHSLAFMAERVMARATAAPPPAWYQLWAAFFLRPVVTLSCIAGVLALVAAWNYPPVRQVLQRHAARAFVIYRAHDGTPVFTPIEYQRVTPPEDKHGST